MIAIPVMRGRVAPVLNWCSRLLLFPASPAGGSARELNIPELEAVERLHLLQAKGVSILICGALSADLDDCATQLGFRVIPGVAGEVDDVVQAYRQNRLDRPEFWLPGCRGPRRYRQDLGKENGLTGAAAQGGQAIMPGGTGGKGAGQGGGARGRCRRAAGGPGAGIPQVCICPACGAQAPHERGIPCFQVSCPQCSKPMCGHKPGGL
jgi:predicted Fe-Mo cluster-binding NifX family protein